MRADASSGKPTDAVGDGWLPPPADLRLAATGYRAGVSLAEEIEGLSMTGMLPLKGCDMDGHWAAAESSAGDYEKKNAELSREAMRLTRDAAEG